MGADASPAESPKVVGTADPGVPAAEPAEPGKAAPSCDELRQAVRQGNVEEALGELAQPILECVGAGEEQPGVERHDPRRVAALQKMTDQLAIEPEFDQQPGPFFEIRSLDIYPEHATSAAPAHDGVGQLQRDPDGTPDC